MDFSICPFRGRCSYRVDVPALHMCIGRIIILHEKGKDRAAMFVAFVVCLVVEPSGSKHNKINLYNISPLICDQEL